VIEFYCHHNLHVGVVPLTDGWSPDKQGGEGCEMGQATLSVAASEHCSWVNMAGRHLNEGAQNVDASWKLECGKADGHPVAEGMGEGEQYGKG